MSAAPTAVSSSPISASVPTVASADQLVNHDHQPLLKSQQQYLELLNQYQLLKMRRQMLEEQAAIAQAQNRIAVLNDQTRKLDTAVNVGPKGSLPHAPAQGYQLSYIDQPNGQWTASIYTNGVYQVVNKSSVLSDGAVVSEISQRGVIIQKSNQQWLISFDGVVSLPPAVAQSRKVAVVVPPKPKPVQYQWQAKSMLSLESN
jgi:hypothetical protein